VIWQVEPSIRRPNRHDADDPKRLPAGNKHSSENTLTVEIKRLSAIRAA
jgi:hypothetical protein